MLERGYWSKIAKYMVHSFCGRVVELTSCILSSPVLPLSSNRNIRVLTLNL